MLGVTSTSLKLVSKVHKLAWSGDNARLTNLPESAFK